MSSGPFLLRVLAGTAVAQDVDDFVDQWHDDPEGSADLAEYLGMTADEYALWVEKPEALRYILASRKLRAKPLRGSRQFAGIAAAAAARAGSDTDAQAVLRWLRRTGRLTDSDS
jgi:hypothetical protein